MDEISKVLLEQIKEIDARDEQQILAEIAGETISEMFYVVKMKDRQGKPVEKPKLSWAGTKDVARARGNIMVEEYPQVTNLEDGLRIIVKVTDISKNFSIFGGCHQPYKMKVYDYDNGKQKGFHYEDDPFCFQKGLSKAQRNAIQTIMPADFTAKCLNKFMLAAGTRQLPAPAGSRPIEPPGTKLQKAKLGWGDITQDMVTDYPVLERIFWDLTKKQPLEMYQQFGVANRSQMTMPVWEAFLYLKSLYEHTKKEAAE